MLFLARSVWFSCKQASLLKFKCRNLRLLFKMAQEILDRYYDVQRCGDCDTYVPVPLPEDDPRRFSVSHNSGCPAVAGLVGSAPEDHLPEEAAALAPPSPPLSPSPPSASTSSKKLPVNRVLNFVTCSEDDPLALNTNNRRGKSFSFSCLF